MNLMIRIKILYIYSMPIWKYYFFREIVGDIWHKYKYKSNIFATIIKFNLISQKESFIKGLTSHIVLKIRIFKKQWIQ